MQIDISRDSFDVSQAFSRVLVQQNQPILDRDWNEHTAIVLNQLRMVTRAIYGRHGGPPGKDCGFAPLPRPNESDDVEFSDGQYSVEGLVSSCQRGYSYRKQPHAEYDGLPQGRHLLVLELFESIATLATDPQLAELALPAAGPARGRICWRVRVAEGWDPPKIDDQLVKEAVVSAEQWCQERLGEPPELDLSEVLPSTADRLNNELLRVEFHCEAAGRQIWKISHSNAFALFRVTAPKSNGGGVQIDLGTLANWAPESGQLAEFLTRNELLMGDPGKLLPITRVARASGAGGGDAAIVQLGGGGDASPEDSAFLRVWDDKRELEPRGAGLVPGDFLQWPVRGFVEEEQPRRLRRPLRVFAPLAVVDVDTINPVSIRLRLQHVTTLPSRRVLDALDLKPRHGAASDSSNSPASGEP